MRYGPRDSMVPITFHEAPFRGTPNSVGGLSRQTIYRLNLGWLEGAYFHQELYAPHTEKATPLLRLFSSLNMGHSA